MIHRYQKKGLNFVLDVNSGAVHLLDDISYAVSGLIDENMTEACPESVVEALPQYSADDVREGVAIMHAEGVDVSITGNSTNPTGRRTGQGALPARCARLQPQMQILLCVHRRLRPGPQDHAA